MSVSGYMHKSAVPKEARRGVRSPGVGAMSHLIWMQETKLRSAQRVVSGLSLLSLLRSPHQQHHYFFLKRGERNSAEHLAHTYEVLGLLGSRSARL